MGSALRSSARRAWHVDATPVFAAWLATKAFARDVFRQLVSEFRAPDFNLRSCSAVGQSLFFGDFAPMTRENAFAILESRPADGFERVRQRYAELMSANQPTRDFVGSPYLQKKVHEAWRVARRSLRRQR